MPIPSKKYFSDHNSGSTFNNQEAIARELRRLGKSDILEADETNPLTVRLFQAKEGLDRIKEFVSGLDRDFPRPLIDAGYYVGPIRKMTPHRTIAASGSPGYDFFSESLRRDWTQDPLGLKGLPASILVQPVNFDTIRIIDEKPVYTFYLHSGVYTLFASLESTLDRVRLELNSIYFDGGKIPSSGKGNRYWGEYTDPKNDRIQKMKNAGFAVPGVLTGTLSVSLHQTTAKYRNRLIHDGDLPLQVDESIVAIYLPDDPLITPPTFTSKIQLLPFVESAFADLQVLLHDIYQAIIRDLNPPTSLPLIP